MTTTQLVRATVNIPGYAPDGTPDLRPGDIVPVDPSNEVIGGYLKAGLLVPVGRQGGEVGQDE